jgi:thiol:disulfide interchange protein
MFFAFLGRLILNLMTCVLRVISLKAIGFLEQAGGDLRKARFARAVLTAGVVGSFLSLAGTLLLLRAGGEALGWGFQLQKSHHRRRTCVRFSPASPESFRRV